MTLLDPWEHHSQTVVPKAPRHYGYGLHMTPYDEEYPWHKYKAWHPVHTEDEGTVWAWPWRRVPMYRRFVPSFCYADQWMEPLSFYAIDPSTLPSCGAFYKMEPKD